MIQDKTDFFGSKINFNFDGDDNVTSLPGAVISILFTILFSAYGLMKFQIFINQLSPNIQETLL